jgi:hypothetical protein
MEGMQFGIGDAAIDKVWNSSKLYCRICDVRIKLNRLGEQFTSMKNIRNGIQLKSRKQQKRDAELGLIIDEMDRAMWSANKEYVASMPEHILTPNMNAALCKFQDYCARYYGKKS